MKELEIEAVRKNTYSVLAFVDEDLEAAECPMLTQTAIDIAVEEIFVNIANYAYGEETGTVVIQVTMHEDPPSAEITFIDSGIPFDPLARKDPDTAAPAEERGIGGLGIYMAKNAMDEVRYEYKDGQNVLTLTKKLR